MFIVLQDSLRLCGGSLFQEGEVVGVKDRIGVWQDLFNGKSFVGVIIR